MTDLLRDYKIVGFFQIKKFFSYYYCDVVGCERCGLVVSGWEGVEFLVDNWGGVIVKVCFLYSNDNIVITIVVAIFRAVVYTILGISLMISTLLEWSYWFHSRFWLQNISFLAPILKIKPGFCVMMGKPENLDSPSQILNLYIVEFVVIAEPWFVILELKV